MRQPAMLGSVDFASSGRSWGQPRAKAIGSRPGEDEMKWIYWTIFCAASVSACGPSNQALVDEAERAYQAGEMELAIVYYEEAVEKVPEDLVAKTRLALLLIREGDRHAEEELWASALARYERGLDLGGEGGA